MTKEGQVQRRYWEYKDDDATIDLNKWLSGILKPGVYAGFDFEPSADMNLKLSQSEGQVYVKQDLSESETFGILLNKQGLIFQEEQEVTLPVNPTGTGGASAHRTDLIIASYEYTEVAGGQNVIYSIIEGTVGSKVPPVLTDPNRQIAIGELRLWGDNIAQLDDSRVSFVKYYAQIGDDIVSTDVVELSDADFNSGVLTLNKGLNYLIKNNFTITNVISTIEAPLNKIVSITIDDTQNEYIRFAAEDSSAGLPIVHNELGDVYQFWVAKGMTIYGMNTSNGFNVLRVDYKKISYSKERAGASDVWVKVAQFDIVIDIISGNNNNILIEGDISQNRSFAASSWVSTRALELRQIISGGFVRNHHKKSVLFGPRDVTYVREAIKADGVQTLGMYVRAIADGRLLRTKLQPVISYFDTGLDEKGIVTYPKMLDREDFLTNLSGDVLNVSTELDSLEAWGGIGQSQLSVISTGGGTIANVTGEYNIKNDIFNFNIKLDVTPSGTLTYIDIQYNNPQLNEVFDRFFGGRFSVDTEAYSSGAANTSNYFGRVTETTVMNLQIRRCDAGNHTAGETLTLQLHGSVKMRPKDITF